MTMKKAQHDERHAETFICLKCSLVCPRELACYGAAYLCRFCQWGTIPMSVFERWYNDGNWGVPVGMSDQDVAEMLMLNEYGTYKRGFDF